MRICTPYGNKDQLPVHTPEKMSRKTKVETAGYVPLKRRIEDFMAAGQRLQEARAGLYDSQVSSYDIPVDPTRKPGLDAVDAAILQRQAVNRLRAAQRKAAQELADRQAAEAAAQGASGASGGGG